MAALGLIAAAQVLAISGRRRGSGWTTWAGTVPLVAAVGGLVWAIILTHLHTVGLSHHREAGSAGFPNNHSPRARTAPLPPIGVLRTPSPGPDHARIARDCR